MQAGQLHKNFLHVCMLYVRVRVLGGWHEIDVDGTSPPTSCRELCHAEIAAGCAPRLPQCLQVCKQMYDRVRLVALHGYSVGTLRLWRHLALYHKVVFVSDSTMDGTWAKTFSRHTCRVHTALLLNHVWLSNEQLRKFHEH